MNKINLGDGIFVITTGIYEKLPAMFIEKSPKQGVVGNDASDSGLPTKELTSDVIVITFKNIECIKVMIEELQDILTNQILDGTGTFTTYRTEYLINDIVALLEETRRKEKKELAEAIDSADNVEKDGGNGFIHLKDHVRSIIRR